MSARVLLHPEATDDPAVVSWVTTLVATASRRDGDPPLLADLIATNQVADVQVLPGRIDVTASAGQSWRVLGGAVRLTLVQELQQAVDRNGTADSTVKAVADVVLARQVGELVRSHGGLLTIEAVTDGVVTVARDGACGHCPASMVTVNDRFETALRREVPWLREVRSHSQPRPHLWGARRQTSSLEPAPEESVFVAP